MTVTSSLPRRLKAWASSAPIGPPPSTSRRRGSLLADVASTFVHGFASRRPSIGGIRAEDPIAITTARRAVSVRVPPPSLSSTSTVRSPARRPWPRTSSMPSLSSHGVCVSIREVARHVVALRERPLDVEGARDRFSGPGHAPRRGDHVARTDQGLRRDAAEERAFAPDQPLLDDRDGQAGVGAPAGRVLSRWSGPDHDHVERIAHGSLPPVLTHARYASSNRARRSSGSGPRSTRPLIAIVVRI